MKNKRSNITTVFVFCMMLMMCTALVAQDTQTLLAQLTGQTEAPQRRAAQLETAYQTAIKALLPLMSAEDVESRYAHQITLQYMAAHASRPGAQAEREVMQAWRAVKAAQAQVEIAAEAVAQAEEWLRMIGLQYQEELVTATDLLDAETALTQARIRRLQALHGLNVGLAQLEFAAGIEQ